MIEDALRDAGVSDADRDAGLELFGRTAQSPVVSCSLRLRRSGDEVVFSGALGPALLLYGGSVAVDGSGLALLGLPDEFPRAIVELVELGPRPCDPSWSDVPMPVVLLDACAGLGCDEETLDAIVEDFAGVFPREAIRGLLDGEALRWTLTFPADTPDGGQGLDVIDAGERGLWLIEDGPRPGAVWARPMTSTAAWLLIVGQVNAAVLAVTT